MDNNTCEQCDGDAISAGGAHSCTLCEAGKTANAEKTECLIEVPNSNNRGKLINLSSIKDISTVRFFIISPYCFVLSALFSDIVTLSIAKLTVSGSKAALLVAWSLAGCFLLTTLLITIFAARNFHRQRNCNCRNTADYSRHQTQDTQILSPKSADTIADECYNNYEI